MGKLSGEQAIILRDTAIKTELAKRGVSPETLTEAFDTGRDNWEGYVEIMHDNDSAAAKKSIETINNLDLSQ